MPPETVRREPPSETEEDQYIHEWRIEGILDLAAGRHAVGCECVYGRTVLYPDEPPPKKVNACLTIARALLKFTDYEVRE